MHTRVPITWHNNIYTLPEGFRTHPLPLKAGCVASAICRRMYNIRACTMPSRNPPGRERTTKKNRNHYTYIHNTHIYIIIYCVFVPFEFTIQKCVLAKLNMVICASLYIRRRRFVRSPFSRPIYNENALRERIKAFFFFNLCDTVRTSYTYIYRWIILYYCDRRLADGSPPNDSK